MPRAGRRPGRSSMRIGSGAVRAVVTAGLSLAVLTGLFGAAALAAPDRAHWADGYALDNDPNGLSSTPLATFNRAGGPIQVTKPSGTTGRYLMRFTGLSAFLGANSTVHITGTANDDTYCKPTTARL